MATLVALIEQYGLIFVFLNVLLEQGGLPLPSYPTLMLAAALAPEASYRPLHVTVIAVLATLVADLGWYAVGRRHGHRVVGLLCRISLSPDSCVQRTDALYARLGPWSLVIAKFVPGLGLLATALAGAARTRLLVFIALDAVGAALWAGSAVGFGIVFRDAIEEAVTALSDLGHRGVMLLVIVLAGYLAVKWLQRWRFARRLRMDRITVDELAALMESGHAPAVLDVRPARQQRDGGTIPGAIAVDQDRLHELADHMAHGDEVVVYCACPNEASAVLLAKRLRELGVQRIRPLRGGIDAWVASGRALHTAPLA